MCQWESIKDTNISKSNKFMTLIVAHELDWNENKIKILVDFQENEKRNLILAEDSNTMLEKWEELVGKNWEETLDNNGIRLLILCTDINMLIGNMHHKHKEICNRNGKQRRKIYSWLQKEKEQTKEKRGCTSKKGNEISNRCFLLEWVIKEIIERTMEVTSCRVEREVIKTYLKSTIWRQKCKTGSYQK